MKGREKREEERPGWRERMGEGGGAVAGGGLGDAADVADADDTGRGRAHGPTISSTNITFHN